MDYQKDVELKRLKDKLESMRRYNQERHGYISNVSRRIREPMEIIMGIVNMAQSFGDDAGKLHDFIRKMGDCAGELVDLANQCVESRIWELEQEGVRIQKMMERLDEKGDLNVESFVYQEWLKDCRHQIDLEAHKQSANFVKQEGRVDEEGDYCPNSEGEEVSFRGGHMLVVEDNEINRDITKMLLRMKDAKVHTANNGREAVEMFQKSRLHYYDAILMDVKMPVKDGFCATKDIRGLEREDAKRVPIIATMSNAMPRDVEKALQSGMNAHVGKPVDTERLFWMIRDYVNH